MKKVNKITWGEIFNETESIIRKNMVLILETDLKEVHPFSLENMNELQKGTFERIL